MNNMAEKIKLKNFFETICEDVKIVTFDYASPEEYFIVLKCRVEANASMDVYNDYVKNWVNKFAKFTLTGWIVRNCYPRLKRLVYRKSFVCHLSNHNKKKTTVSERMKRKDCRAKIDFRVKFINRNTIKNDSGLKDGLNMNIVVDFNHSHKVLTQEAVLMLRSCPETDKLILSYCNSGYTTHVAKRYHELTIIAKHGEKSDAVLRNSNINPSSRHFGYLGKKLNSVRSLPDIMADKKAKFEEQGGAMRCNDDYSIIGLVTPFMKYVLSKINLDTVILDSSQVKDGPVVSLFYVHTSLGALPIACALHSEQSEGSFSQAIFLTKRLLESLTLNVFEPKLLIGNHIKQQMIAADSLFNGRFQPSTWSMSEKIWIAICEDDNKPRRKLRHTTMSIFHSAMHSSADKANQYIEKLQENELVQSSSKLTELLRDMSSISQLAASQGHNDVLTVCLRTIRRFLSESCKSFTAVVMTDVLLNVLDKYWDRILRAHLHRTAIGEAYTVFINKSKVSYTDLKKKGENEYCVEYTVFSTKTHRKSVKYTTIRTDIWACDCFDGMKGHFCDHLYAALRDKENELAVDVTDEVKASFSDLVEDANVQEIVPIKIEKITNEVDEDFDMMESQEEEIDASNQSDENQAIDYDEGQEDDNYYYVVSKAGTSDPLEEGEDNEDTFELTEEKPNIDSPNSERDKNELKMAYEGALMALNQEFRRLNRFFKGNPNPANLSTINRLVRELKKIRPVERVDLSNMHIALNEENMESD